MSYSVEVVRNTKTWDADLNRFVPSSNNDFIDIGFEDRFRLDPMAGGSFKSVGGAKRGIAKQFAMGGFSGDCHFIIWEDTLDWTNSCGSSAPSKLTKEVKIVVECLAEVSRRPLVESVEGRIYDDEIPAQAHPDDFSQSNHP